MHRCTISHIDPDSPLRHAAHPGDRLVSINGNPITDVLDYKYYAYDPQLAVCLRRPDGSEHTVHIVKPLGGELGLDFETYLMDNAHSCANHCVFCFIDQMPPGMRPTLYFKDDDARLSFLMGNYMTLTNLSEREVQRIIDLHISPINVSVHATDPELRSFLLGNPRAGKTLEIMRRFADGGITMNCQIVCCPGLNDGAQLQRTMRDLAALYPQVHSVSIVPVGLTKFREGLYPLTPFTPEHAAETLDLVNAFGDECVEKFGTRIFFCADELYLKGASSSSLPIFSFKRCLSMVRTCSKSTMESFCRPVRSAWSAMCVGRFVLSRWLVMAAAITVGLNRLPTSFCTISTGRTPPCSLPTTGLKSA